MTKQIRHTFHFACTPDKIMNALTEAHHIQKWWTKDASVKSGKGQGLPSRVRPKQLIDLMSQV